MKPATEAVLKLLTQHLKAEDTVGEVVLGGFERTKGGKELLERLAGTPDKLLVVVGVDPVDWELPTVATRAYARWQERMTLSVATMRRLGDGMNVYGARFGDSAWLAETLADFTDRLEDSTSDEIASLAELDIGVVSAGLVQTDYAPGEGADLDAGLVSVAATVQIAAEVVAGEAPAATLPREGVLVTIPKFRFAVEFPADTVPLTAPAWTLVGKFSLYHVLRGLGSDVHFKLFSAAADVNEACDVATTYRVTLTGIGVADKVYTVGLAGGVDTGSTAIDQLLALSEYQVVTVEAQIDTIPGAPPVGVMVRLSVGYEP